MHRLGKVHVNSRRNFHTQHLWQQIVELCGPATDEKAAPFELFSVPGHFCHIFHLPTTFNGSRLVARQNFFFRKALTLVSKSVYCSFSFRRTKKFSLLFRRDSHTLHHRMFMRQWASGGSRKVFNRFSSMNEVLNDQMIGMRVKILTCFGC